MKMSGMALGAAIACICFTGSARGQQAGQGSANYQRTAYSYGYFDEEGSPSDSEEGSEASVPSASNLCDSACDGLGNAGCFGMGRSTSCDGWSTGGGCFGLGGCNLGEPWRLVPVGPRGWDIGGWSQVGYHTYNTPFNFNEHRNRINLHQQWVYAEKVADGSEGLGFGGRIDYLYGVDAQDTQAFGTGQSGWDNPWDNGIYGHAIPQAYVEAAYGNLSVKAGHFFTLIGYEVVAATGNFFYSHNYTMYNSEPFTHTGVLTSYELSDQTTVYNGYVLGWDSGFDDNGDAWLTGLSHQLNDVTNITYGMVQGRFGEGDANEVGEMHSLIVTRDLGDKLTYVFWADYLNTARGQGRAVERRTFGVTNMMLYTISDCLAWGNRVEWYNVSRGLDKVDPGHSDIYTFTTGLNYRPHANLIFRPEVRWDWDRDGIVGLDLGTSQTTFGMDAIFTF